MSRLKVAIVSDALYPWHKGGKEVRYEHLLRHLPEHDLDVVVYSMKWWETTPPPMNFGGGSLVYRSICPRLRMYKGKRRSFFQAAIFALSTLQLVFWRFDVIEADQMPYLQMFPLRFIAWFKRVPLVITWHEVWGKDSWRSYIGAVGSIAAKIESVCAKLPDRIIAVSSGTAEKLVQIGARRERIQVVPNALNLEELAASVPNPSAPELLCVGRLIEHKRVDLAIEAIRILVEKGIDVHLGIVGTGPEESRLRSQVDNANLGSRVTFYRNLDSQNELWSLICGSRVLLAPSTREGFGIVVAESLALGTPVVCSNHPENESMKLVSPRIGSIVPPLDAMSLACETEFWLIENSTRQERSLEFLSSHHDLSVEAMVESYAQILRNTK